LSEDEKSGDSSLDDDEMLPELPDQIDSYQEENIEESIQKKPESEEQKAKPDKTEL